MAIRLFEGRVVGCPTILDFVGCREAWQSLESGAFEFGILTQTHGSEIEKLCCTASMMFANHEPVAQPVVGANRRATPLLAIHTASRRWLSFLR